VRKARGRRVRSRSSRAPAGPAGVGFGKCVPPARGRGALEAGALPPAPAPHGCQNRRRRGPCGRGGGRAVVEGAVTFVGAPPAEPAGMRGLVRRHTCRCSSGRPRGRPRTIPGPTGGRRRGQRTAPTSRQWGHAEGRPPCASPADWRGSSMGSTAVAASVERRRRGLRPPSFLARQTCSFRCCATSSRRWPWRTARAYSCWHPVSPSRAAVPPHDSSAPAPGQKRLPLPPARSFRPFDGRSNQGERRSRSQGQVTRIPPPAALVTPPHPHPHPPATPPRPPPLGPSRACHMPHTG